MSNENPYASPVELPSDAAHHDDPRFDEIEKLYQGFRNGAAILGTILIIFAALPASVIGIILWTSPSGITVQSDIGMIFICSTIALTALTLGIGVFYKSRIALFAASIVFGLLTFAGVVAVLQFQSQLMVVGVVHILMWGFMLAISLVLLRYERIFRAAGVPLHIRKLSHEMLEELARQGKL